MNPFHLKLQKKLLYKTTLFFIVLAFIGNMIGYKRSLDLGMVYSSIIQSFLILIGFIVFLFQKQMKLELAVSIIICLIMAYGISGMVFYGFSASGKFLLFLGPLFFYESISFKKNLILFFLGISVYILLAILIFQDIISISIDHNIYVSKLNSWILDAVTLFSISFSSFLIRLSSKNVYMGYLKELEKSDHRFRQIFNNSNEAIVLLKDFTIYDCNQKALDLFDCNKVFILKKHVFEFSSKTYNGFVLDNELLISLSNQINYERIRIFEWEFVLPSGVLIILEVHLVKVEKLDEGISYMQAILRDVTEKRNKELAQMKYQKVLEEKVEQRTKDLLELNNNLIKANSDLESQHVVLSKTISDLNKAKSHLIQSEKMASIGVLTAGVAHEINNPLNFIQSGIYSFENILENGHLMGSEAELLKIKQKVLVQMNEGVRRVSNIVKSLNRFSRSSDFNTGFCNINDVIDNCLLILNHEIKEKCTVRTNLSKEMPIVFGDEGKMHQIFINVIHNAIQSMEHKGVIEVRTKMNLTKSKVIVHVRDEGCGIDAESLKKVFDPFYTTKRAENGTGLGLSIVYNLVKEQHAKITIKSELGKGTIVSLLFLTEVKKEIN